MPLRRKRRRPNGGGEPAAEPPPWRSRQRAGNLAEVLKGAASGVDAAELQALVSSPVPLRADGCPDDARYWRQVLWCTPLYYRDALKRWPERHAAAIAAVARARPGGVLIHCGRGNDRTGIIAMLLLALVGVGPDDIAADYALSPNPSREELLTREHTSAREVILAALASLDIDAYLRAGGLSPLDLAAVRTRLLEPLGGGVPL